MQGRLTRLRAQIVKELLSVLRDPRSRFVLLGPPIMQLLIYAFAATLEVRHIDLALLSRDNGRAAQEFVQQLGASDLVRSVRRVTDEAALADLIDRQAVIAAIALPETFSADVAAGRGGVVQVLIDGRRANAGQVTLGYLQTIAANTGATLTAQAPSELAVVRHWFNPNLIYRWFVVPGLAGILVSFIALLLTALSIARERELGTFDQLLVSPCTPTEIIVAKTVPAFVIGTALVLVMVGAGVFGFGIPFTGSFAGLLASLVLFILSLVGMGLAISAVSNTQQQAILGTFAAGVPMILMSGFATPVENMPVALQWLAEALPLKHFLIILQGSYLKAMPAHEVWTHAWPMAVIAVVTLAVATLFVRSKLQ